MKTRLQTLLFCMLICVLAGCQKEGYFVPKEEGNTGEDEVIEIISLDYSEMNAVSLKTVVEMADYTCIEINDLSDNTQLSMFVIDKQTGQAVLVSLAENSVLLYDWNATTMSPSDDFIFITMDKLIQGRMDWSTLQPEYKSSIDISREGAFKANSHYEYGDHRDLFFKCWDETMDKGLSTMEKFIPEESPSRMIINIWKNLPIVLEQLITIDDEELEQVREAQIQREGKSLLFKLLHTKSSDKIRLVYKSSMELYKKIAAGIQTDMNEVEIEESIGVFNRASAQHSSIFDGVYPESKVFKMYASGPYELTKNSAKIKGSFEYKESSTGANIIQKGILWAKKGAGFPNNGIYMAAPDGAVSWETKITGLEEATTYQACAYLSTTSGGVYYSDVITFTTKGLRLTVSPNSLNFPEEGGSMSVNIETNENAEWTVVSKPSWCSIKKEETKLSVSVSKNTSTEQRDGEIVVQSSVAYEDGTKEEPLVQVIKVTQEGKEEEEPIIGTSNFSNTKWNINSGTVKMTMTDFEGTETSVDALESGVLTFGEISADKVEVDGLNLEEYFQSAGVQFSIVSSTDTKLVLRVNVNLMGVAAVTNYTFTRTSPNTMSGIISATGSSEYVRISLIIEFTGMLIK